GRWFEPSRGSRPRPRPLREGAFAILSGRRTGASEAQASNRIGFRESGGNNWTLNQVGVCVKAFGFLSFGHYAAGGSYGAREALQQAVEIGVGADEIGVNGAYFRVHHFAEQAASPIALLSAIAARTSGIEVGTGVIDMRYRISGLWHWGVSRERVSFSASRLLGRHA